MDTNSFHNDQMATQPVKPFTFVSLLVYLLLTAIIFLAIWRLTGYTVLLPSIDNESSSPLVSQLRILIKNGANLQDVQHALERYYATTISPADALRDTRIAELLSEKPDLEVLDAVDRLITEYEQVSPFGVLDRDQQYFFETVRAKLGESYTTVEGDINRIAVELHSKNITVNQYLADATLSLQLAKLAIALTVWQIILPFSVRWLYWIQNMISYYWERRRHRQASTD